MYTHAYCHNCKEKREIRTTMWMEPPYTELVCNHCHTVIAIVYEEDALKQVRDILDGKDNAIEKDQKRWHWIRSQIATPEEYEEADRQCDEEMELDRFNEPTT